jgi:hypothetical protein
VETCIPGGFLRIQIKIAGNFPISADNPYQKHFK